MYLTGKKQNKELTFNLYTDFERFDVKYVAVISVYISLIINVITDLRIT